MNTTALVIGAWIGGFMLPELLVILAPRDVRTPLMMNFIVAAAAALIVYGLHA